MKCTAFILIVLAALALVEASCGYDDHTGRCSGGCSGENICVQIGPGFCQCVATDLCYFDYSTGDCIGECETSHGCYLVADMTCECTDCGWLDHHRKHCSGFCRGDNICMQASAGGECSCNRNMCQYDYAEHKCKGPCSGSNICKEVFDGYCECVHYGP
ncbi:hypothetical protein KIPB_006578 [Kipferlia bialata]|uniref:EGF-like domain-containing protein n=1 Tax=Kipferlia bialata TaxID=797122 RepID=A0A9K3CXR5_9EUKA|nr:hypothetical protein KIPB_006578 [Kipferlia bialata]|eukprot:g6578.t1